MTLTQDVRASGVFPSNGTMTRRLASLHGVRADSRSPASTVLSRRYDSRPPFPPRFVAFAWRYHPCTLASFPAAWRATPRARGFCSPLRLPLSGSRVETTGPPTFLGNPFVPMPCSPTPAEPTCQAIATRRHGPRSHHDEGSRVQSVFRGSITRLQHSLSTLRSPGYPGTTQDSLPVAGQLYRTGLATRRVPAKGFRMLLIHGNHPPFPSFVAQGA